MNIHRNEIFLDWVLSSFPEGASVLDVGANDGTFCPEVARVAVRAGRLAGVDPDGAKLANNKLISERYFSTLEDADLPAESFDVLYSFFVFEHVANEERFVAAASRALKPGGSLFFLTPNGQHYFAFLASMFEKMGVQRRALGMLRPKELVESYHYPALYRLNHPRTIERIGRKYRFDRFEYRYSEELGEISSYFPGPTKIFPKMWESMVAASGCEHLMLNLHGRMIKAG